MSLLVFRNPWVISCRLKRTLLRAFGARVGRDVVIKPSVQIKFPWRLVLDDYAQLGEHVWLDNLAPIHIGAHATVSQGCYLTTGNHDFRHPHFRLRTAPIVIEAGCWIAARCTLGPGTHCQSHSVLLLGSVASGTLEPFGIYRGNPAVKVGERTFGFTPDSP